MNTVIVTSSDPFAGIFWKAYRSFGGPLPKAVFLLEERKDLNYPFWQKIFVPFLLFGIEGTLRLILACYLKIPLTKKDKELGLHLNYKLLKEGNCKFYHYKSINEKSAIDTLISLRPDIVVSVGAPVIFKKEVLEIPKLGVLNIHNALVPKYRGHFGTFWEVFNNEKRGYISLHKMDESVDAGGIVAFDYLDNINSYNFLDLMIEKKYRGAKLLSKILKESERIGMLFKTKAIINEIDNLKNYFGLPSFKEILNFRRIAKKNKLSFL